MQLLSTCLHAGCANKCHGCDFCVVIIISDLHTLHFDGTAKHTAQTSSASVEETRFSSSFAPFFSLDDLEEDQKQTKGLGRSDTDEENKRSDNSTRECRLREIKESRWRCAAGVGAPCCNPFATTCTAPSRLIPRPPLSHFDEALL